MGPCLFSSSCFFRDVSSPKQHSCNSLLFTLEEGRGSVVHPHLVPNPPTGFLAFALKAQLSGAQHSPCFSTLLFTNRYQVQFCQRATGGWIEAHSSCLSGLTESEGPCPEDLGLPTPGLFWLIHPDLTQLLVGIIKFPTLFPPCFWFLFLKCTHFLDDLTQPGLCGPLRLPASSAQTFGCLASPCAQFSARWSIWVLLQHSGLNMSPWSWFSFKWAPSWGSPLRVEDCWNSLAVQWLELHASTVGDPGSIPGGGTKILHAGNCSQKLNKNSPTLRERVEAITSPTSWQFGLCPHHQPALSLEIRADTLDLTRGPFHSS